MARRNTRPPAELRRLLEASSRQARESAWANLVEKHSRLLLHTVRRYSRDHDAAMDRYAYVLDRLREDDFKRLRSYVADGRGKFTTWLVVVTRRLCLDHRRQRYGRARDSRNPDRAEQARQARRRLVDLVSEEVDVAEMSAGSRTNPELQLRHSELRRALEEVLERLEPSDRLLLRLRFDDEVPVREIADVLDYSSVFQVYRRINTICDQLREELRAQGIRGPSP